MPVFAILGCISSGMELLSTTHSALTALSPLDGRYVKKLPQLASVFSDFALTKQRLLVEVAYVLFLSNKNLIKPFSVLQQQQLHALVEQFSVEDAVTVQTIEQTTRHDVKAVEYFLRAYMRSHNIPNEQYVHFALTSEDVNSLAYGLMLQQGIHEVIVPQLQTVLIVLTTMAKKYATVPMLARTHGQRAVPTTMGKELAVFAQRLLSELELLSTMTIEGKLSGAVGNLNAHTITFIDESILELSTEFVESLGLYPQLVTTQILPPENVLRIFSSLLRINGILLDCAQDCWRYISDGYLKQSVVKGQVGSSTMPQKINPIDFENAEGNLGIANALLIHFLQKLPVSRLQRDLSDSTVKRNFGSMLGYCSLSYQSLIKGLEKVSLDRALVGRELDDHWEVLAEAYQIVLRQHGISNGYELLKDIVQGETCSQQQARGWIEQLTVSPKVKKTLAEITPRSYIGIAPEITQLVVQRSEQYLKGQYEHS